MYKLSHIIESSSRYQARKTLIPFTHKASVALILREHNQGCELLMLQRAIKAGDPWSGHMAFPGGKQDHKQEASIDTAIRETFEETSINLSNADCLGRLSDLTTRTHNNKGLMTISPWIFQISEKSNIQLNHESQRAIWLPLDTFAPMRREQFRWPIMELAGKSVAINLPCFRYDQAKIWGLSLIMLDEFMDLLASDGKKRAPISKRVFRYFK